MSTEKTTTTFLTTTNLSSSNSFGLVDKQANVELSITVGINSEDYGWFELYDTKTGGDRWYAEGGLWFENKTLTDYDGVFSLPIEIIEKLEQMGYNADYAK